MKYNYYLFDSDNTLLNFSKAEMYAHKETCKHFNIKWNKSVYLEYDAINDKWWKELELKHYTRAEILINRYIEFLQLQKSEASPTEVNSYYMQALKNYSFRMKYASKVIKELYKQGKKIYIITNGASFIQKSRLKNQPFIKYIDHVFISEELKADKPSKDFFANSEKAIGFSFPKEETLVIGDSQSSDIQGGINYNFDTCLILNNKEINIYTNSTYTFNNLKDLYNFIKKRRK